MALRSILRSSPAASTYPSTAVVLECDRVGDQLVALRLRGGGYGHGLGLCQHGARGMALQGHAYDAILNRYYAEVDLVTLDQS
jgi:SpoIID/LytB domain protein